VTQRELAVIRKRVKATATDLYNAHGYHTVVDGRVYVEDAQTLLAEVDQLRELAQNLCRAIQVALDGSEDDMDGAISINEAEEAWEGYMNEAQP
jgi:hypothetical protein